MSVAIRVLLVGVLFATPGSAHDLRTELARLAREAKIRIVLDRSVEGPLPSAPEGGDAIARIRGLAEAAGYQVVAAAPRAGRKLIVVTSPRTGQSRQPCVGRQVVSERVEIAPPPELTAPASQVVIDAMVADVSREVVSNLVAIGNHLPSAPGAKDEGSRFLDGLGPGVCALSFDRVDPRLNAHVPWGDVGLSQPGCFTIRERTKSTTYWGTPVQVPLEVTALHPCGPEPTREAVLKGALEVTPTVLPGGRIRLVMRLKRGVLLPLDVDPSMARGGRIGVSVDVVDGGELLITGLGQRSEIVEPPPPPPEDPLERFRRPRFPERDGEHCHPPVTVPTEVIVRLSARVVR